MTRVITMNRSIDSQAKQPLYGQNARWTRLSPSTHSQSQCLVMEQSLGDLAWNVEENPERLATVMGNPSTDSVKEAPETGEFSPRSTPWEGIQPKIVIHPLKPLEFTPRPGIQPNRINTLQSSA
ncbi:hypothetical protein R3P38DRAFT_2808370 [Favolaschia claudopus]|uniref:Prolactin receptor n=1 Tax=Favolaschia claudopus TaxID=2862362 RepID=A0AAV9ZFE9_9AGAR